MKSQVSYLGNVSNQRFMITGISVDRLYYRIDFSGQEGWIFRNYSTVEGDLTDIPVVGAILIIGEGDVPVRRSPEVKGQVVGNVSNRRFMITGITADHFYYRIDFDGTEAWVFISYGRIEGERRSIPIIDNPES